MRAFDITVPAAVEAEIRTIDKQFPQRLYPDTALFDQLRDQLRDPPDPEPSPWQRFGAGEAAAIALSRSTGAVLLINDRRPAEFARNLGLPVVTCPGMIVVARSQDLISSHMAHAMMRTCGQHGTSPAIITEATLLLTALG